MSQNYIEFRKQRDVGEVLTDSFKFIRLNFKPLFGLIFRITGPVFLILLLALGYYSYLGMNLFDNPFLSDSNNSNLNIELLIISLFILISSLLAFYTLLYGTVLHFINSYITNKGEINRIQILQGVKNDFGKLLGLMLLVGIITFVGLIFCILPGVYLWVPLSLAPALLIFARTSVTDAISYAFKLVKDNWWMTFLTLLVVSIIVYIIGMIFQFPMMIYYFIKAITLSQEGSVANPADLVDWVYVFFNVLSSLFQYLLLVIIVIASAFIYYSLDEQKNATGTYERISNLGS